jgi:asparagine N-glycosylation enzyme membrane subunit Stt3
LATIALDSAARLGGVEKISAVTFSETPPNSQPLPPGCRQETILLPQASVDARWWVIHTREMLREGAWRIRHNDLDNAPAGREVHWSSFLMWVLALLAWVRSWGTGQPAEWFVADAAVAAGPLLLAVFFSALWWTAQRAFGWLPATFYLLVLLTTQGVVRTFELGEADHHGIVLVFASACALCLIAGGAGFARRTDAMAPLWFVASGLAGAAAVHAAVTVVDKHHGLVLVDAVE